MNHLVTFLSREKKSNQKKTPIIRDPAGCPALLGKGALSTTRFAQTALRFLRPFLRCSARLKGEVQNHNESQPPLRGLPDAFSSAGGASFALAIRPLSREKPGSTTGAIQNLAAGIIYSTLKTWSSGPNLSRYSGARPAIRGSEICGCADKQVKILKS